MYRHHALWLGTIGMLIAATSFLTSSSNVIVNDVLSVFYASLFLVIFAFLDSTVRVARRSDPLLRSILHWERLRVALWADAGGLAFFNLLPAINPAFASGATGQLVSNIGWSILGPILFVSGAAALTVGARRSRDPLLRRSLKWLGVFLLFGLASFIEWSILNGAFGIGQTDLFYSYPAIPGGVLYSLMAYALYRSARSLAPMNRFQTIEPVAVYPDVAPSV